MESNAPLAADAWLDLSDVSAVIDRTAVTNLSGRLMLALEVDTLTAALRDIRIGEIDSGIGIGPIQLLADYEANLLRRSGGGSLPFSRQRPSFWVAGFA